MYSQTEKALFELMMFQDMIKDLESSLKNTMTTNKLLRKAKEAGKAEDVGIKCTEALAGNTINCINHFLSETKFQAFLSKER